jgi:hypothetical protein
VPIRSATFKIDFARGLSSGTPPYTTPPGMRASNCSRTESTIHVPEFDTAEVWLTVLDDFSKLARPFGMNDQNRTANPVGLVGRTQPPSLLRFWTLPAAGHRLFTWNECSDPHGHASMIDRGGSTSISMYARVSS